MQEAVCVFVIIRNAESASLCPVPTWRRLHALMAVVSLPRRSTWPEVKNGKS